MTKNGQPYFTTTLILGQGRILDLRPIPWSPSSPLQGSGGGDGDGKTNQRVALPTPPQHMHCHHNSLLLVGPETMHQFQASFQNRKKTARKVTPQNTKPLPGAKTVTKVMTATTCPPQVAITFRKTRTIATTPPPRPPPPPPQPTTTTTSTSTSASTSTTTPIRSNRVTFSKTTSMTTEPEVCRVEKQIHQALGMANAPACGTTTTTAMNAYSSSSSSSKITNITINYVAGDTAVHRRPPLGSGVRNGGAASTFQHRSVAATTAAAAATSTTTSNTDTDSRGKTAATTIHNGSKQKKDDGNDTDGAISEYIPWYHDSELIGMFLLGILLSWWMK